MVRNRNQIYKLVFVCFYGNQERVMKWYATYLGALDIAFALVYMLAFVKWICECNIVWNIKRLFPTPFRTCGVLIVFPSLWLYKLTVVYFFTWLLTSVLVVDFLSKIDWVHQTRMISCALEPNALCLKWVIFHWMQAMDIGPWIMCFYLNILFFLTLISVYGLGNLVKLNL